MPHTHLLFGGSREGELVMRQRGADYLEILQSGGGILSTVAATRAASDEDLAEHGRRWLAEMLAHGTTTIEAKSGYGLDLPTELRLLEIAYQLGKEGPVDVLPTWLGAHAVAPEFRARPDGTEAYVRHLLEEQLPGVAAQGRARFADVFCERGVFSPAQSRRVLLEAARLGLGSRLHADELAPSGGAELAAEIGALSADHLAVPSQAGIDALAAAAGGGSAGRRGRPAGHHLVPDARGPSPGADLHRARHPGRAGNGLQPRHLADAEPAARDDGRLPRAQDDPVGGARGDDDQCRRRARDRRRGGLDRDRPLRGPRDLARPDAPPDPVLARRGSHPGRGQARPRRPGARRPQGVSRGVA